MTGLRHACGKGEKYTSQKRVRSVILFFIMLLGFTSCIEMKDDKVQKNGELVIYSLRKDGFLEATVPLFEEKYGIRCRVLEEENTDDEWPVKGDVIVGATEDFVYSNQDKLMTYVSVNDKYLMDRYRNTEGYSTAYMLDGSCLIANRSLVENNEINGYNDLLKPKYRGQIVVGNPLTSAAAFSHLTSMLFAMGGVESEEAWEYLDKLLLQVGETVSDSAKMYDDVAAGRMMIGLAGYLLKPINVEELIDTVEYAKKECDIHREWIKKQQSKEKWKEITILKDVANQELDDEIVRRMLAYVHENYRKKIVFQELIDRLNYSDTFLNKRFKDAVHTTFTEYLNRYRVQKSIERMIAGETSVQDIAIACGIPDYKYFSVVFRKFVGCTPKEYMNSIHK